MRCLQFSLLLFSLVFAVHCRPEPEEDQNRPVKREEAGFSLLQQQASIIDILQADLTAYKNQVDSYNDRLDSLKDLKDQLDSYNNQVDSYENKLDSYKNQVDSYENQVESMGIQLQAVQGKADAASKSVAFTARISYACDSIDYGLALEPQQTVVFDDVVTNIGNAYDNTTGVFTAPVNGIYVFSLHEMSPNKRPGLYLAIVKNGTVLDLVYSKGSGYNNDQGSGQVSTYLAAGDQVWVRLHKGSGVRASWWTVFTGFLLHAE